MDEISVHSTGSSGGDARSDLLQEIRQGIQLKSVNDRENLPPRPETEDTNQDALAKALRSALENRLVAIRPDSDDDDSNESFDDEEWN